MAKKKKDESTAAAKSSDFGHEIWGLVFLSFGVLVLISLVSHFVNNTSNVLGYYFGTALSSGLIFLLGPVAAFFFPLSVCYLGWVRLKGESISVRRGFYAVLLTLEVCFLLAIHHLPNIAVSPELKTTENFAGMFIVKHICKPVFGVHTFGPYFLGSLALLITVLWCLRISPQRLAGWISAAALWSASILSRWWQSFKEQLKYRPPVKEKSNQDKAPAVVEGKAEKQSKQKKVEPQVVEQKESEEKVAPVPAVSPVKGAIDDVEEQARQQLEKELAAFRARKEEPIKIMSVETAEVDTEEEGIDEGAIPFRIDDEEPRNEKKKAPVEEKPQQPSKPYRIPDPSILPDPPPLSSLIDKEGIERNSMVLEKTLLNFGVEGKVVFVSPGPVVTRYEIELAPGIKVSRVVNLHDDISMAVCGQRIRIEAPIPGKSAVGIELPNSARQIVHFKHILSSDAFRKSKAKLPAVIGTNISGAPYVTDITKMPHVLIAGQTGSGKSVCINSIICSLLMTKKPEELRLIMIDPKKVELAFYEGTPHLMSPVVTESKEAVKALQWGVIEMERRYKMLAKVGARNIDSFNTRLESGKLNGILSEQDNKPLPFIVILVDELADLMMTASKDVEGLIQRIAQLARAVGIHLIVATQRPSVDIITGPIKANLTSRIAFRTIQSTDSRTILGHVGAEKLLGMGDMLFLRNGAPEIERFHGAFISEEDVERIVADIRSQQFQIEKIESFIAELDDGSGGGNSVNYDDGDRDELFEEAARTIVSIGQGSTSLLQRRMKIGYARAGRLMDELERAGFVGPQDGSKAREVLVKPDELELYLETHR
ncbi:MAG: DNA translocase FtsK [Fibrobacter sp.]|nr:DNA translocase FtsK [Fibrobacter sp.]